MNPKDLSVSEVLEYFEYDPKTGDIYTKRRKVGCVLPSGYVDVFFDGGNKRAHRIAHIIMTGANPQGFIDHINGNKSDNRWENLRVVSKSENAKNAKLYKTNTSGLPGVTWDKHNNSWIVRLIDNGKVVNLGRHKSIFDAAAVSIPARERRGFSNERRINVVAGPR